MNSRAIYLQTLLDIVELSEVRTYRRRFQDQRNYFEHYSDEEIVKWFRLCKRTALFVLEKIVLRLEFKVKKTDEKTALRVRKQKVTFGLIGGLAVCSIFFCTNHGSDFNVFIAVDAVFTYCVLHFLLLLVVLWIYGRERFQRDIEFMLGQQFASWKIYILRFIAPIILVICLLIGISWSIMDHNYVTVEFLAISIIVVWLPLLAIPAYGLSYLSQSTGTVWDRLRRTCRPTDWYPVEMEYRQKYQEAIGTTDTHQLFEVTDEVN